MKRCSALTAVAVLLLACGDGSTTGPVDGPDFMKRSFPIEGHSQLTVMTRNVYVGGNVDRVIGASSVPEVLEAVAVTFAEIQSTDFAQRAEVLADEIVANRAHLVGLQEISMIFSQTPGDFFAGNPVQASDVVVDFLPTLLAALDARGADYRVAAVLPNTDVELPSATGQDLRLVDHEVILARGDVEISEVQTAHFGVNLTVPVGGAVPVTILRGWAAVRAVVDGRPYRFVSTHLEPAPIPAIVPVQVAQAQELIARFTGETLPLLFVGDFNSAADGSTTPTYGLLIDAGFADAWSLGRPRTAGLTCCHASDLRNAESELDERIDLILVRDGFDHPRVRITGGVHADIVGEEQADRTPSGLWPSDHAGVAAILRLAAGAVAMR